MEVARINPYGYESQRNIPLDVESPGSSSASSSGNDDEHQVQVDVNDNDNVDRLGNTHWCSCDRCNSLLKPDDCVCCREMPKLQDKLMGIPCITEHPDFVVACQLCYAYGIGHSYRGSQRHEKGRFPTMVKRVRQVFNLHLCGTTY